MSSKDCNLSNLILCTETTQGNVGLFKKNNVPEISNFMLSSFALDVRTAFSKQRGALFSAFFTKNAL